MGLERYLSRIGEAMAPALADDLAYHHTVTAEDVTVVGFLKWKADEQDPIGRPTKRQRIPVIRVHQFAWHEDDVAGDFVVAEEQRWRVTGALTRASGWTDLYVADPVAVN